MSVVVVKATVECDDCGKRFHVELDEAEKVASVFEACCDAMIGGQGSYFDDVMRCDDCTSKYISKWIEDHPTHVSGVVRRDDHWLVTTYDDREWIVAGEVDKPEHDKPLSDYPHQLVTGGEA